LKHKKYRETGVLCVSIVDSIIDIYGYVGYI